jgi:DNA-binding beta-propeller fold protein YncE
LFAPYYRRDFDKKSVFPSAMAVIDTSDHKIKRVMSTGPIAKFVRASPRDRLLAVSHWGDNTVGLYDIASENPADFKAIALLVVEEQLPLTGVSVDRDRDCGFCVRGLAFTPDDRYLFVSRMRKGGIAAFDLKVPKQPVYLGTLHGINPGPRDLEITHKGDYLYSSCNASGFVSKVKVAEVLELLAARESNFDKKKHFIQEVFVGLGARSIELSADESNLFVAVNNTSELISVDAESMSIVSRIGVDSFPVGLGLSPDDSQIWITSQGKKGLGGNSVSSYLIRQPAIEILQTKRPSHRIDKGNH